MGAWIETSLEQNINKKTKVAPYVGAWIETRGCRRLHLPRDVAPYVGAWIETDIKEPGKR